ncbi:hypothetical protein 15 [Diadegma semiclausum ichnovirus]|nr:hypothetical protein 15 [Diadegma semiclausum ichnovirus]
MYTHVLNLSPTGTYHAFTLSRDAAAAPQLYGIEVLQLVSSSRAVNDNPSVLALCSYHPSAYTHDAVSCNECYSISRSGLRRGLYEGCQEEVGTTLF